MHTKTKKSSKLPVCREMVSTKTSTAIAAVNGRAQDHQATGTTCIGLGGGGGAREDSLRQHCLNDGADAVMLTASKAINKHPAKRSK
mmetsp:Transcript_25167/g.57129  ORF Transcript_25167/g.57129 Transcript_25167/m.57129 type:complete len:87 (-) Transcript_25167:244-504(-)